ncbi:MAG: adenosylcobinamide-GDP ribazoletransferase [Nitrospirae bacterium]|nr:adenosylcobinamide-GDP ribazoletransferase [Nitrospirota bacterium]
MRQIMLAIQFLTILPMKIRGDVSTGQLAASVAFFPLVGALQGLLLAGAATVLMEILSSELTSGLVIALSVLINGGLHIDGLSDTFDGLAVKPSGSRADAIKKRLAVMKDSAAGAIGVTAIVILVMLKYLLIANLLAMEWFYVALSFIVIVPVLSRWAMVIALKRSMPASDTGLGNIFIKNIDQKIMLSANLITFGICIFVMIPHLAAEYAGWVISMMIILVSFVYVFSIVSVKFLDAKFGGLTGDHAGALCEVSEIIILLLVSIWSGLYIL